MSYKEIYTAVIILLFSTSVISDVVTYDESTDTDLSYSDSLGVFGTGLNTVSGTTGVDIDFTSDFDGFVFTVQNNNQVDSISIDYSPVFNLGVKFAVVHYPDGYPSGFDEIAFFYIGSEIDFMSDIDYLESGTDILSYFDLKALPAGEYGVLGNGFGRDVRAENYLDYTIGVTVSEVPLPPAFYLFGTGLIGLLGFVKRKNS